MYNITVDTTLKEINDILFALSEKSKFNDNYAVEFQRGCIGAVYKNGDLLEEFHSFDKLNEIFDNIDTIRDIKKIKGTIEDLIKDPKVLEEVAEIILNKMKR